MNPYPNSVVLVLVDGMRPDGLRESSTPVMDGLIQSGSSSFRARSVMPTITLPCITSLFHSTTAEMHGITGNKWTPAADMPPSLFSVVRSKERKTASICNWEELRDLSPVGSLDMAVYIDNSYDAGGTGDRLIAKLAAESIRRERFTFTFVYLGHVDVAGHKYGYMSAEYLAAISAADASIGILLESLEKNTTTIVLADHGGHEKGHGSECDEDMLIPIMLNGPRIPRNSTIDYDVNLLDIAPTIASILQIPAPDAWLGTSMILDGSMLEATPTT